LPAGWVSAGVAAAGLVENTMANSSAASAAKKNNAAAAGLQGAQNTMLDQAQTVANQPFQAYTGTMTAPMSGNQQQAYSQASQVANSGAAQADNTAATGLIGQVANNGFSGDTINKYMSPYTSAVTDASVAASNKNYLQNLSQIQTNAAGSGAFGGSRAAISQATLASNQNLNVGTLTATGNANAFDSAVKSWQADNSTKLNAAQAYENAGQDVTAMNSAQISDLIKTGGVAQVINQTDLANQYGQFMRQQNWSAQQLGSLISAVRTAKGSPTQQAPIQSNTANQLLGLGSTVAGLFGGGSTSTSVGESFAPDTGSGSALQTGAIDASAPSFDSSSAAGGGFSAVGAGAIDTGGGD
jgi:hypothetical protein